MPRALSSLRISPASIVLPRPTSSARRKRCGYDVATRWRTPTWCGLISTREFESDDSSSNWWANRSLVAASRRFTDRAESSVPARSSSSGSEAAPTASVLRPRELSSGPRRELDGVEGLSVDVHDATTPTSSSATRWTWSPSGTSPLEHIVRPREYVLFAVVEPHPHLAAGGIGDHADPAA